MLCNKSGAHVRPKTGSAHVSEHGPVYVEADGAPRLERRKQQRWQREPIGIGVERCPVSQSDLEAPCSRAVDAPTQQQVAAAAGNTTQD
jgi:hypothetical protein